MSFSAISYEKSFSQTEKEKKQKNWETAQRFIIKFLMSYLKILTFYFILYHFIFYFFKKIILKIVFRMRQNRISSSWN